MEDQKNETITASQNGTDVQVTKQELQEKAEGTNTRVTEGKDGKPHILSRMNG